MLTAPDWQDDSQSTRADRRDNLAAVLFHDRQTTNHVAEGCALIKTSFSLMALALALAVSSASAMPLAPRASIAAPDDVVNAKIVCSEDGYCYQRGRPPVARWVYGDKNFSGQYVGPGHYFWPGYRWRWFWF